MDLAFFRLFKLAEPPLHLLSITRFLNRSTVTDWSGHTRVVWCGSAITGARVAPSTSKLAEPPPHLLSITRFLNRSTVTDWSGQIRVVWCGSAITGARVAPSTSKLAEPPPHLLSITRFLNRSTVTDWSGEIRVVWCGSAITGARVAPSTSKLAEPPPHLLSITRFLNRSTVTDWSGQMRVVWCGSSTIAGPFSIFPGSRLALSSTFNSANWPCQIDLPLRLERSLGYAFCHVEFLHRHLTDLTDGLEPYVDRLYRCVHPVAVLGFMEEMETTANFLFRIFTYLRLRHRHFNVVSLAFVAHVNGPDKFHRVLRYLLLPQHLQAARLHLPEYGG